MKANSKLISSVVILIALFLFTAFSIAKKEKQVVKIELEKTRVLFLGVDNPILVTIPGVDPKELRITVYGGHLRKDSVNPNRFFLKPASPLDVRIEVKAGKIIANESFRVKDIQNPVFYFGNNSRDCTMSHDEIRKELGVFSRMVNCDFSGSFKITSFSMSLYTNEKWNESTTEGPAFTEAQKKDLAALQPGDRIIFHHINVKGNHGFDSTITRTIPGMFVTVQ